MLTLLALKMLFIYVYATDDFKKQMILKKMYNEFGQDLPVLYIPIQNIAKNSLFVVIGVMVGLSLILVLV